MHHAEEKIEGKYLGRVVHYFDHARAAVIDLEDTLEKGDTIRVIGGKDTDFTQEVKSMERDHEKVKSAKKGDSVGIEVEQKVREGYKVYRV